MFTMTSLNHAFHKKYSNILAMFLLVFFFRFSLTCASVYFVSSNFNLIVFAVASLIVYLKM